MAAQLLSNSVAKGIELVLGNSQAASFFKIINDGFDILNSRVPVYDKHLIQRNGFGKNFEAQNEALEKLKRLAYTMRFGKRKGLFHARKDSSFLLSPCGDCTETC